MEKTVEWVDRREKINEQQQQNHIIFQLQETETRKIENI